MWVDRLLSEKLIQLAHSRPAVVVTGARQTGKTSLIKRLFPAHNFVSLDLPSMAESAEHDSTTFLQQHGAPLVIDEVQYAPGLFRHLKIAIDANRSENGRFIMTGSQKFSLMKEVSDSLAGRAAIVELEPLSVLEIESTQLGLDLESLILRGGYPELYEKPSLDPFEFYRSYISTYLERDVRQILNVVDLRDFERFLRAAALRSGQLLNKAELARDVGIHPTTANQWLSVLQASNQIQLLEPWFSNQTKSIVKTPKLYISDSGLLCALLSIRTVQDLAISPHRGAIWESFVYSELRKRQIVESGSWNINFWRDKSNEIDFVVDRGGVLQLCEAKWTERPKHDDLRGIFAFKKQLKLSKIQSAVVVCRSANDYPIADDIAACSISSPKLLQS